MQIKTKFLGTPTTSANLSPGDIFFVDAYDRRFLVFLALEGSDRRYFVLRAWGKADTADYPHYIEEYIVNNTVIRRITDELVLEIGDGPDTALTVPRIMRQHELKNGEVSLLPSGELVLCADVEYSRHNWDLHTGANINLHSVKAGVTLSHWRLIWTHDDERLVLCEFNKT